VEALVLAGSGIKEENWKEQYWNCVGLLQNINDIIS
jgi:hypothetical protein